MRVAAWALVTMLGLAPFTVTAQGATDPSAWPRQIDADEGKVVIYQPQVDSFIGDVIESRAAIAVTPRGQEEPVFGAIWSSARVETDRDTRTVRVVEVKVKDIRLPEASEEDAARLAAFLEREIPKLEIVVDLDQLIPTLERSEPRTAEALKNDPPKILVRRSPALLVVLDGSPRFERVETTSVDRVVNTPYVLLRYRGRLYLSTTGAWFEAGEFDQPWRVTDSPPKQVRQVAEKLTPPPEDRPADQASGSEANEAPDTRVPEIVVSTEPAELIVIDGDPKPAPVADGELLEITNTESDLVFSVSDQRYYALLSGRWYRAKELDGPWAWVANDALPEAFARIPEDSSLGYLRTSVAGTEEAQEALLDQVIPQTAAVKRSDASATVTYDGAPRFQDIEGTSMRYAVNTASSVILVGNRYYLCDQGVWYVSSNATGPWRVCDDIPKDIYTIPPSSPVYNVTYVHVYQATPQVVYVGYTPGYVGSYVSHGCVVYGTGWHYRPWWGTIYYPRPATWGFHVRYNPWYGWTFGVSWSNGPFTITVGSGGYHGGWWGPGWYRPYPWYGYGYGYRHGYRHGYWAGAGRPSHPIAPPGAKPRPPAGATRPSQLPSRGGAVPSQNIYNRPANRDRLAQRPAATDRVRPAPATGRPNDVMVGPDGNVYRHGQNGGWQSRENGAWRPATPPSQQPSTRPSQPNRIPSQPGTRPSQPSQPGPRPSTRPSGPGSPSTLDRDWGARQRGSQRSQTYRSAPAPRPMPSARPSRGRRR